MGGLKGQPNYAYLKPEWLDRPTTDPKAVQLVGFEGEGGIGKETEATKRPYR